MYFYKRILVDFKIEFVNYELNKIHKLLFFIKTGVLSYTDKTIY